MESLKTAFIFPGQGESHSVGMCKDFYDAYPIVREMFEEASSILGYDLAELVFNGPLEKLSETQYCQIAIYVVSVAVLRVIQQEFPKLQPEYCAGLSLGEYTAATAAGVITFSQGVQLIHARGTLMQKACHEHPSTMAVVLGLDEEQVQQALEKLNRPSEIWMANLNCPGQIVVSGSHEAIEAFIPIGKEAGAKRVLPLNVAGAFHTPYMKSAADEVEKLVEKMTLSEPATKLMMNASGKQAQNLQEIQKNLVLQITSPVRWQSCVEQMKADGVESFVEIGCGKVLSGLNKRMGLSGQTCCINTVKDLEFLKTQTLATS